MLPKREKLSRASIEEILKGGKRVSTPLFSFIFRNGPKFKATVVVSKKVEPESVKRHILKRKIMRVLSKKLFSKGELVILCQKRVKEASFSEIEIELIEAKNKIEKMLE